MKKSLLLLSFFYITFVSASAQGWQSVGSGFSSSYGVIKISDQDSIFVATREWSGSQWKASVKKYDGTNWVSVGTPQFSAGEVQQLSLAIDSSGVPYVAYRDQTSSDLIVVKKYNGSSWVNVGNTGSTGSFTMAFDNNNVLHIAFRQWIPSSWGSVIKFNGSSWVNVGAANFTGKSAQFPRIAFDNSNTPYFCHNDATGITHFWKFDGANWVTYASSIGGGGFQRADLVFHNNEPYVFYIDGAETSKGTVKKYDGSNWIDIGGAGFTSDTINNPNMVIDDYGNIYVAFADQSTSNYMTVMKYDGTSWGILGTAGQDFFNTSYNDNIRCIALDSKNDIYKYSTTNSTQGVKKFDCWIDIADTNFKAYLVSNSAINTNADSEIQCNEAALFSGTIDCRNLSISDMTGIEEFINLTALNCSNNQITTLDVSQNTNLISLDVDSNQLSALDVTSNTSLTDLSCNSNLLTSLHVANGNNSNFTNFSALNNTGLTCIWVDNATYSTSNWTNIDGTATFGDLTKTVSKNGPELTADYSGATYQWIDCDDNDSPISGETNQTFIPSANGNYACIISNGNCEVTSNCVAITNASVQDGLSSGLTIYPNPASSYISFDAGSSRNNIATIRVLDFTGKVVKSVSSKSSNMDISDLPTGMYTVVFNMQHESIYRRFVKK